MITFLVLNILMAYSAFLIVFKALKIYGSLDAILAWFVVYICEIILIELLLGIAGVLYLKNIIILSIGLFIIAHLLTQDKKLKLSSIDTNYYLRKALSNKIYIFVFSVAFSFFFAKVLINLLNPPFGWDSLNYHFTFAVEWLKHGNLYIPPTVFDDPSPSYYPINGSLFYLWLMLPFKSVFIADLGQAPFFIAAVICVYAIARKAGLGRKLSIYSAMLFMLIPNLFKQLQIAYVDVMVATLLLICVNYLFLLNKKFNFANCLIFSLSLGLLIGTKTVALPYAILLIIPFLVSFIKDAKNVGYFAMFILSILVFGGFSYLRNFFDTGNPLYPLDFKLFNIQIFKGVIDNVTYKSHYLTSDYYLTKALFHEGLGAQGLLLILPGMFLALPVALAKKRRGLDFYRIYFFILPILLYLCFRFIIPLPNLRYLYALMGIGIILGFYIFDCLQLKRPVIDILFVISVLVSITELAKRTELIVSLSFTFLLFIFFSKFKRLEILMKRSVLVIFLITLLAMLFAAERFYNLNEFPRYYKMRKYSGFWEDATKAWDWLNSNTAGNNIAYAGRPVPFPLYGSGFKNNVYYVSVNKIDPIKIHFLKNSRYHWDSSFENLHKNLGADGNYRANADYKAWFNNLTMRHTDYLFVYSLHQTRDIIFPIEDNWAKMNPGKFSEVFSNSTIHIYRLLI